MRSEGGGNRAMFLADWNEALFIHFRVDSHLLAPAVPFELDLQEGVAYVSLVAFTQSRLRPTVGGQLAAWLSTPLAEHAFLNLRAYVRVNGEPAIYFMSEWIPNRLAALVGPRLYGLPYKLGVLEYEHGLHRTRMTGRVAAPEGSLEYAANFEEHDFVPTEPGSLDHFLLERYIAYTFRRGVARRFVVRHEPWPQTRVSVKILDKSLFDSAGDWSGSAEMVGANFSPGVRDVGISAPITMTKIQICR